MHFVTVLGEHRLLSVRRKYRSEGSLVAREFELPGLVERGHEHAAWRAQVATIIGADPNRQALTVRGPRKIPHVRPLLLHAAQIDFPGSLGADGENPQAKLATALRFIGGRGGRR